MNMDDSEQNQLANTSTTSADQSTLNIPATANTATIPNVQSNQNIAVPQQQLVDITPQITYNKPPFHLPAFNTADPKLWFLQVEDQFTLHNIHDENVRYTIVSSALPHEILAHVRDIIGQRPLHNPYTIIKTTLLQRLTVNLGERLKRLFKDEVLGDQRPSQLLMRMKTLANDCFPNIDDELLKTIFLQRLPPHVQQILAVSEKNSTSENLAESADNIIAVNKHSSIHAINNITQFPPVQPNYTQFPHSIPNPNHNIPYSTLSPNPPSLYQSPNPSSYLPQELPMTYAVTQNRADQSHSSQPITLDSLAARMTRLEDKLDRLLSHDNKGQNSRDTYRGRSQSRNRNNYAPRSKNRDRSSSSNRDRSNSPNGDECWYHAKFAEKAKQCREGCKHFRQQGN